MASRLCKDSVVLDIGANIGNHSIYLAKVVGCRVVCFEPDESLVSAINFSAKENRIQDKITIHNVAVGDAGGFCRLEMNPDSPDSVGSQQVVVGHGAVPMITIDSLQLENIDCIKIDVEGFEEKVLIGAIETIRKNKPIIYAEAWNKESLDKILKILKPLGYSSGKRFNATPTYILTIE
jgi:FkbM family methyltransferase